MTMKLRFFFNQCRQMATPRGQSRGCVVVATETTYMKCVNICICISKCESVLCSTEAHALLRLFKIGFMVYIWKCMQNVNLSPINILYIYECGKHTKYMWYWFNLLDCYDLQWNPSGFCTTFVGVWKCICIGRPFTYTYVNVFVYGI